MAETLRLLQQVAGIEDKIRRNKGGERESAQGFFAVSEPLLRVSGGVAQACSAV